MVSVNHWKCMTVRGDYVVSTSKADHFHPFSLLLETGMEPPGTYTTLGFSWICPTPSTYALPFSLLLETIGTTWNLYDPRILLDVPCPPVPEMYGCTDVQVPPPFIHDKQKTSSWCWGVDSWGRRIMRTMGW